MPKLYCIISNINNLANPDTFRLLKEAAENRGVEFVPIDAITTPLHSLTIEDDAMIYRISVNDLAVFLEASLVKPSHGTFYTEYSALFARAFIWGGTLRSIEAGLPIIPTVFKPYLLDDDELERKVSELGGYPIVVKGSGGSHGSAVRSADSLQTLRPMLEEKEVQESLVLRKFIHQARHIRVIVIGKNVVDAIEYDPQPGDFRTNAVAVPTVHAFDLSDHQNIKDVCVQAVECTSLEFGGVDILIQPDGSFYIAEVNYPCNFARNQMNTGVDVAGAMVEHLLSKIG